MYPIAFAIVPVEDTANWSWFLTQLKYALGGTEGEFGKYTIMSDRQKVCLSIIPFSVENYALEASVANHVENYALEASVANHVENYEPSSYEQFCSFK